jgi:riboflavin synthase
VRIHVDPSILRYIVPKGYIAVDGTSLTVCEVDPASSTFTLMLIEYTQKKIVLPTRKVGDKVNIEVDVLGKYAEKASAGFMSALERLEAKLDATLASLSARLLAVEDKIGSSSVAGAAAAAGSGTAEGKKL